MNRQIALVCFLTALCGIPTAEAQPVTSPADPLTQPFSAREPLKLTKNAKTFGGFRFAESISYDAGNERPRGNHRNHLLLGFLDDDHLLARTTFGRLILIGRRGMRLLGTVWAEGQRVRAYDERGNETDDPGKVIDFETGLVRFFPAGLWRVLGVFDDGTIRLLDLSPLHPAA